MNVTETLARLDERAQRQEEMLDELRRAVGDLKVKVALISSGVASAATFVLNWVIEHHK